MEAFNVHLFIFFSHTQKADSHAQKFAWDFFILLYSSGYGFVLTIPLDIPMLSA